MSERSTTAIPDDFAGSMLDSLDDLFFTFDERGRLSHWNRAVVEVTGYGDGELDSMSPADFFEPGDAERVMAAVADVFYDRYHEGMRTQEPVSFREHHAPPDTWFDGQAYPSESGLSGFFHDVTEQQRHRERIESRERVLREVYDVVANVGRSFDEQVEALVTTGRDVLADVADDAPDLAERAGYTEWGISCYLGAPLRVDGEIYGTFRFYDEEPRDDPFSDWQVTLVDLMAQWVSYELERRRANERLARKNERLEEFASIVSHDLRNPLNVLQGSLDIALAVPPLVAPRRSLSLASPGSRSLRSLRPRCSRVA